MLLRYVALGLWLAAGLAPAHGEEPVVLRLAGSVWQVVAGQPAPWLSGEAARQVDLQKLLGQEIQFRQTSMVGPSVSCKNARFEFFSIGAAALFQGNLGHGAVAEQRARQAGFHRFPVATASVTCDAGIFDYHFPREDQGVIALDNVLWTLQQTHTGVRHSQKRCREESRQKF